MNDYSIRYNELNEVFKLGEDTRLTVTNIDIRFFPFQSNLLFYKDEPVIVDHSDEEVNENLAFEYPVFIPRGIVRADKAILLMHGLNERNWSKYLTWAEYLCEKTGKPVILFPIAFHVNRSPQTWSNPRIMQNILNFRKNQLGNDRSISFANVALSQRIYNNPLLFYSSGRQTLFDLTQLLGEIKLGKHPIFKEDTHIDIFAYSIGAFLSQITLMTNLKNLFSDSKLFMFCGGSIFSSMFGVSRSIMDRLAFNKLHEYYLSDFEKKQGLTRDNAFEAFYSMISPERSLIQRESFFKSMGDRLQGISLKQDIVIPYKGVRESLGAECTTERILLLDFSFQYSHENPFPIGTHANQTAVNDEFKNVFSQAAGFLT